MKQLHFQFSPRVSQQELREIKDLYLRGELLKNIATDYCVTQSYISLLARQHGWQMRYSPRLHPRRPNGKIREDAIQGGELKQLLTWALDGVGHKTIAYRIGRHKNTVSRIALANGIRRYKREKPCPPQLSTNQLPRLPSISTQGMSNGSRRPKAKDGRLTSGKL